MRIIWVSIGVLALGCGMVGLILPLVPTTPFLLLAAFAFARSSPRLHRWLVTHRRLGPPIDAWCTHGAIGRRTKWFAIGLMPCMLAGSWFAGVGQIILLVQALVLTGAALFIVTRPTTPVDQP
jgi:hypothetical protein